MSTSVVAIARLGSEKPRESVWGMLLTRTKRRASILGRQNYLNSWADSLEASSERTSSGIMLANLYLCAVKQDSPKTQSLTESWRTFCY